MKNPIYTVIALLITFACSAMADEAATSYHVIKTSELTKLLSDGKGIAQLKVSEVARVSIAQGYFEGQKGIGALYLKTKDIQFRIKMVAVDEGVQHYSLSLYSQTKKERIFTCSGNVSLGAELSAPTDWKEQQYTIVVRKINLKK